MTGFDKPYVLSEEADTFPKLLRRNYLRWGNTRPALRKKEYGIWKTYTWKDYYDHVKHFALGLISLGLQRGDNVSILGDNDPEWWLSALAAQSIGGVQYGIFVDCAPSEVQYFIDIGDAAFVVVKDQEQCDKLLEIKDQIPRVKKIIYWDPKGMWAYDDPMLMEFQAVLALGKEYEKAHPNLFEEHLEKGKKDDIACFCFTSGTTGLPKPTMISFRAMSLWASTQMESYPWYEGDDYFSFLCPAWGVDQTYGIAAPLMVGAVVNFPESLDTITEDSREIAAHFQVSGARAWEERYRDLQVRLLDADFIKRSLYRLFIPIGYRVADLFFQNKKPGLLLRTLYQIGDLFVFKPLRDKYGLTRARCCLVGGSMLSPEHFRFYEAIGVRLISSYSLQETGSVSMMRPGQVKLGSSGKIVPGREVRITEEGELLVKNDENTFSGYYKSPEKTAERLRDGWTYTGDSGYVDEEGYLFFIDRLSELSELSNGTKYSPTYTEAILRFSPYIKDVVTFGAGKEYVTAMIIIDLESCGKWAERNRVPYNTFVDLSQKPEICDLVKKEIQKTNEKIPIQSRVKKFVNLHKEFDPDEAELTRTRKLKRYILEEKFADILDALYSSQRKQVHVKSEVKYRDGRTGVIATNLKVWNVF